MPKALFPGAVFSVKAIKVQMYNFLRLRDQNTKWRPSMQPLRLFRARWYHPNPFNVKDCVRIFNICQIFLPTPQTRSVDHKCERFQFRSRSHFGIFPGHWSSRSKQKNTISMEFLQHFRGIQMDTLPVKMAVEFKNIAHFWKYAADENTFSWKRKLYQKSWGSRAVGYLLSVLRRNPQNIFVFERTTWSSWSDNEVNYNQTEHKFVQITN